MNLERKIEIKNKIIEKQNREIECLLEKIDELESQGKFNEEYNAESLHEVKKLIEVNEKLKAEYETMISTLKDTRNSYEKIIETIVKDRKNYRKTAKELFSNIKKLR